MSLTVRDVPPYAQYFGTGSQTAFTVGWEFRQNSDIVVLVDGATKVLNTDYTLTGAAVTGGGTCTFTTAPANGAVITIYGNMPLSRSAEYAAYSLVPASALEEDLANLAMMIRQLDMADGRAISAPVIEPAASMALPAKATRASKYLGFNTNGDVEVYASIGSTVISQSVIGGYLWPRTTAEIAAGVTPTNYAYPEGHMFRYGVPVDGTSDCTAALNKAIAIAAVATTTIKFLFPKIGAAYKFLTKPNTITAPMYIAGEGKVGTALYRDFNGSVNADALFNLGPTGEGFILEKCQVASVSGRSGGSLISAVGDASAAPGWIQVKDCYLTTTGTNTHAWGIYVDGSLKTGAPVGVRSLFLDNTQIFGGSSGAVFAKSVVAFNAANSQTFQAGGTSGKVQVTGTVGNPSYYFKWSGSTIHGIDATYVNYLDVDVAWISGDIVNDSTVTDAYIKGTCTGSIQRNCTRGHYQDSGTYGIEVHSKPITAKTSGTTTNVGHTGTSFTTSCGNGLTFTITPITAKTFSIATAGGAAALVFADYKSTTITLVANPSSEFEASSTPTAGKTGIFKSANSHAISIKNNVGSTVVYDILHLGNVGAVTDPA